MKKLALLLVMVLCVSAMTACSKKDEVANITFMMWDEVQSPVIQENIDKFNKANEGKIQAKIELVPWDNYWTKLDASLETGESADIMWMNVYINKYAEANVIKPLDEFIEKDKLDLTQYAEGRISAYQVDGKQYALPKGLDTVVVAYNKEIFDRYGVEYPKDGWTWNDMRTIAGQLNEKIAAEKGTEYPIVMELDGQPSWLNFLEQNGGYYVSEDGSTCGIAEPGSVEAIQKVVDLMNDGMLAPYTVLSETKGTDLFISGQAGMVFIGSWKATVLEESSLAAAGNVALIQQPSLTKSNASVMGGLGYCLSSSSKNPEAAWELLKYLTSEEALGLEASKGIDIPSNLKAQEKYIENFKNINAQVILDASVTGFPYPSNGNFEWTSFADDAVQVAFAQSKPVKDALEEGAKKAQEVLDEINKK